MCQSIGLPPISTIGFGRVEVSSLSREPSPPARITAFTWEEATRGGLDRVSRLARLRSHESRLVLGLLGLAMLAAAVWTMWEGRGTGIHGDEVFYIGHLVNRNGDVEVLHGLEYFFAPHNSHLVVLGRAIFSAFYNVFGTTYWILRAAEMLGILVAVGLFYTLVQRRTTAWIALAFSVSLLFLGYAQETFLWPFDLHTVYAAAFGLGAFLVLEREDRKGDIAACVLLVLAVLTLEVGICFAVGVAVGVLLREDRWRRVWIFLAPAAVYVVWAIWARKFGQSELELANIDLFPQTVAEGAAAVAGSLFGVNPPRYSPLLTTITVAGSIIAGLAVVALIYRFRRGGVPATLWVSLATLLTYWLTVALGARAVDASRYIFVASLLALLIAADALRGVRVGKWATVIVFLVVAFALRPNAIKLHHGAEQIRGMTEVGAAEYAMMELVGTHAGDNYVPRLEPLVQEAGGSIETQLDASQYREVLQSYGSLGSSLHSVETANEPIPAVADATMVTGYGMYLQGVESPASEAGCTEVKDATPRDPAFFELPPGGVLLGNVGRQAKTEVQVSRFTDGRRGVRVGVFTPGIWAELKIPRDRVPIPWNAIVDGPVRICPLGDR